MSSQVICIQIPNIEQINSLIQLCNSTSSDARLRVKCIGTLECLAQTPTAIEANRVSFFRCFVPLSLSDDIDF
jgi:hypothetical protein